jgi:16S rRNA (cytosine967-C5)-methyltransferase
VLATAAGIIRESLAQGAPADRVLRDRLRERRFTAQGSADVARAVFAWFRWRGLAGSEHADERSLAHALNLEARFARKPAAFDDANLRKAGVPEWLAGHMELTPEFVTALQREPVLWLRARPGEAAKLAQSLPGAVAGIVAGLPEAVRYAGDRDLFRTGPFAAGRFEIQDVSSQGVAVVCAPQPGETWWDACAGEGGKMLHLSDLMQNRGLIWASDRSAARLAILRRRAARAGVFNYRVVPWDGGARPPTRTRFDGVLVDAPCSGVGTWQRNPHARWSVSADDVRELAGVQTRLLDVAAGAVKPGGRLVYAVCTLTREETEGVAAAFAKSHPDFEPWAFVDPFAPAEPPRAEVKWLPQTLGGNGMFVAAWRRVSR